MSEEKKTVRYIPFSQRKGIKPIKIKLQKNRMNDALKTRLWNSFIVHIVRGNVLDEDIIIKFWDQILKEPIDEFGTVSTATNLLRETFFESNWHEAYEFIEFFAMNQHRTKQRFMDSCNDVLAQEHSAYRFVNGIIVSITSKIEIEAIESALSSTQSQPLISVNKHLDTALKFLFDKKKPDYRNSIKESISAIEAHCTIVSDTPKADLSIILKELEKKGLNPVLKSAFNKLYGYTSSSNGIRHGAIKDTEVSYSLARFMLVTCSAFVNYLIDINLSPSTRRKRFM